MELRRRMTEGRGISNEGWLKSSVDYNEYFKTHTTIGETEYETMDISDVTPEKAAERVLVWLHEAEKLIKS